MLLPVYTESEWLIKRPQIYHYVLLLSDKIQTERNNIFKEQS